VVKAPKPHGITLLQGENKKAAHRTIPAGAVVKGVEGFFSAVFLSRQRDTSERTKNGGGPQNSAKQGSPAWGD